MTATAGEASGVDPRRVFVVHGRDERVRKGMFVSLRAIGLVPIEWEKAIAETGSASPYVGQVLDSAFGGAQAVVVLLTPDEIAYLDAEHGSGPDDPETQAGWQARPNVLFEAGLAFGRFPDRTVIVEAGRTRPFSDVTGRHAVRMTGDLASRQALAGRLQKAGCAVVGGHAIPQPEG